MSVIEIFYTPDPFINPKTFKLKYVYRPKVPLKLGFQHKVSRASLECLIDSGADYNVLPAQYGEDIGIPIKKGRKMEMMGIGGKTIISYEHDVRFYLPKDHSFKTTAYFSYEQQLPLLGRMGFFDKVTALEFREKERKIVITYK